MKTEHRNSLDLLRLAAAWVVLFSHQFALLGRDEPLFLGLYAWGELGVGIFFFLSGGLVWASWCRDPHWGRFFARRSLRIFPALVAVVLLTVLVLGPSLTRLSWSEYWATEGTWRYFKTLLLNNQKGLPGVFESNPLASAVNGSLWSLGPEFLAYVLVAVVGTLLLWWRGDIAVAALLMLMVGLLAYHAWGHEGRTKAHWEVLALFGWGACWMQWREQRHHRSAASWWAWAGVLLAFGVYALWIEEGVRRLLLLASMLTLVLAWLSWHAVGQPALRFKPARPA